MYRWIFGGCILVFLAMAFCLAPDNSTFYLGGIMINEQDHQRWTQALRDQDCNTVAVTVYARQGIWNSDNIWWNEEEPSVEAEIRTAKAQGLKVVLVVRTLLDHYFEENEGYWHGMIMPANDSLLASWFEHYGLFLNKWGKVAEELEVDVLAIGSELKQLVSTMAVDSIPELERWYLDETSQKHHHDHYLDHYKEFKAASEIIGSESSRGDFSNKLSHESRRLAEWAAEVSGNENLEFINQRRKLLDGHWRKLIAETRRHFSGPLTYAANFDNYQSLSFWDELDVMGVNAYFGLRRADEPLGIEVLCKGWESVFEELNRYQKKMALDMPVLFTELGYTTKQGCTITPWQGFGHSLIVGDGVDSLIIWRQQVEDLEERAMALRALLQVAQADADHRLQGILYWKLTSDASLLTYEPFGVHIGCESSDPASALFPDFLDIAPFVPR